MCVLGWDKAHHELHELKMFQHSGSSHLNLRVRDSGPTQCTRLL